MQATIDECRPSCGGVDWNGVVPSAQFGAACRPSCGGVDWNHLDGSVEWLVANVAPRGGGVDWNILRLIYEVEKNIAPRVGAWIETW